MTISDFLANAPPLWAAGTAAAIAVSLVTGRAFRQLLHALASAPQVAGLKVLRPSDVDAGDVLVVQVSRLLSADESRSLLANMAGALKRAGWARFPDLMIVEPDAVVTLVDRQSAWNLVTAAAAPHPETLHA